MANFLLIVDPDPDRRQTSALAARKRVAFLPRLRPEVAFAPHYAVAWAAAPGAPSAGPSRVILTSPIASCSANRTTTTAPSCQPRPFDVAMRMTGRRQPAQRLPCRGPRRSAPRRARRGGCAGHVPRVSLASWRRRPGCHQPGTFLAPSPVRTFAGLSRCRRLASHGDWWRRTLWQGVRRLPADHVLLSRPHDDSREQPPLPRDAEPAIEKVDEAVERAAALHMDFLRAALQSSRSPGLQLSGGLDSRLLAGFTTA